MFLLVRSIVLGFGELEEAETINCFSLFVLGGFVFVLSQFRWGLRKMPTNGVFLFKLH